MNSKDLAAELNILHYVESMGAEICREAGSKLDDGRVQDLAGGHEKAAERLEEAIGKTGEQPPEPPDMLVRYMNERLDAIRNAEERRATLVNLTAYEREATLQYSESLQLQHPADVMGMLRRNFDEERARFDQVEEISSQAGVRKPV